MNNKQITNHSISSLSEVTKTFKKGGDKGKIISWIYKIIPLNILKGKVIKLGYCCEDIYKDYPIYLTINGIEKMFFLGKTGIFEYLPETLNNTKEEKQIKVLVTEIKVPTKVNFVLDYYYER